MTMTLVFGSFVYAVEPENQSNVYTSTAQMTIRYEQLDWQTYEFYVDINENIENLDYKWLVDDNDRYYAQKVRYFFEPGDHTISVTVTDGVGNRKFDSVKLNINFWSLYNNYFLWSLYAAVVLVIIYYWIVKIIYLFNKSKIDKHTRQFLEILEVNGWVDHVINEIVAKHHNDKNKHKHIKYI